MTLPAVNPQIVFLGTAQGTFGPFSLVKNGTPIRFRQNSQIKVHRYTSTSDTVPEVLVEGTDYSLTGGPDAGVVTLTAPQTGLLDTERLRIFREQPLEQTLALGTGQDFDAVSVETRFDILTEQVQELQREVGHAWRFPGLTQDTIPADMPLDAIIGKIVYLGGTAQNPVFNTIDDPASISANLGVVADNIDNVNTVATDLSGANTIGTVAGGLSGSNPVGTVASNIAAVITVANNIDNLPGGGGSSLTAGDGIAINTGAITLDFAPLQTA